ncbi:hypothetical protein [uncultured Corynebacterium sp.]|uniref:hypothetical protein n=1 Tax=uncultured Corynebacterium sp. TaxID=159447 RepID=UPI0025E33025|nr:hypothetical protein [uncultured Corynebacterium sp.]
MTDTDRFSAPTGRSGDEWVVWLDDRGARDLPHPDIAALAVAEIRAADGTLGDGSTSSNPEWWAQGVAVHYERAIGRRAVGQRGDGAWSAAVSKTLPGDMDHVRDAFAVHVDAILADRGGLHPDADDDPVPAEGEPRTSDTDKWRYWRCPMADGSRVAVDVQTKKPGKDGAVKSTLAVNHDSLDDEASRDRVRIWWRGVLADLAAEMN